MRDKFVTLLFVPFMTKKTLSPFFFLMYLNTMFIKSYVTKKSREKIIFYKVSLIRTQACLQI
jgi:hypothetical protein